jgi:hypothetical protein
LTNSAKGTARLDLLDAQDPRALAGQPLLEMSETMAARVSAKLPDLLRTDHQKDASP